VLDLLEKAVAPVTWLYRVLTERGKVRVEFKTRDTMSVAGFDYSLLTLRWRYTVVLTNLSKQDALELEVVETNNPQLARLPTHCVRALESVPIELELTKDVPRAAVLAAEATPAERDFWGKLAPAELKELRLVLAYKNDHGRTAYTLYRRQNSADRNDYARTRPKSGAA
jgi:hypothetical protein